MQKELEIAQVNELKFYLAWDYVKDICNDAIREENKKLEKQLKIAVDGLKRYRDGTWWYGYEWQEDTDGWEIAEKAIEQIEELDK